MTGCGQCWRLLQNKNTISRLTLPYFLPHLQPLAGEYQLLFYDQRGTGLSDGRPDLANTIDQFVEELESLRVTFGFEKISLIGHSWGAIIALFYALKHQDHLNKLILVDPVPIAPMFLIEQNQTMKQSGHFPC